MSAPALNTSEEDDATTNARAPAAFARSQTAARSRITSGEIELTRPLASHAIATSPRVSSLTVSACSPSSGCG